MKILLNGFFHENLGDDLFFHLITARYPQHKFYLPVHADHKKAYAGKQNVKLLPQSKFLRGVNKILCRITPKLGVQAWLSRKTDLSVLIGGSMFQELSQDGSDLKRLAAMPRHPKALYILGINFGPHRTQAYLDACRGYLSEARDVCFRDSISYNYFSDLKNTRLGSDMVFNIQQLCPPATQKENTCVISIMDFSAKPALAPFADAYYHFLLDVATQQQKIGRKIRLISFCKWEGDERAIETFLSLCPPQLRTHIQVECYNGQNWQQICERISAASFLIASRFHSMILGMVYGVPTVPISYSNKTMQVLSDLDREHFAITPQMLSTTAADQLQPMEDTDISECVLHASNHFLALDAQLA